MKKLTIKHLDLNYYYEKMANGLEVYVIPLAKKKIRATFTVKYGSENQVFKPAGAKDFIKLPAGIAHFLEHKLFEEEKITPFQFFSKTNAYCNASTGYNRTMYLFDGPFHFKKNLNYLLDYVQRLYLTEANVLKEKGIIKQEIKMYENDPVGCLYDNLYGNLCFNSGVKESIAGSEKDIDDITKKDLELCYQTFYHPKNMFLVISGNVNPQKTMAIVKENQANKIYAKPFKVILDEQVEPDKIKARETIIYKDVKISKLAVNFKINISHLKISKQTFNFYLHLFLVSKFGWDSKLNSQLNEKDLIEGDLGSFYYNLSKHLLLTILVESNHEAEVIKIINENIKAFDIDEELFARKKKRLKSEYLFMPDSVQGINDKFVNSIVYYGKFHDNIMDEIDNLNYQEFKLIITNLNFKHSNYVIVKNNLQKP